MANGNGNAEPIAKNMLVNMIAHISRIILLNADQNKWFSQVIYHLPHDQMNTVRK